MRVKVLLELPCVPSCALGIPHIVLECSTRARADEFLTELQNLLVEYTDQDLEVIEDSNGDEREGE